MHSGLVDKRGFNLSVAAGRSFLFIISTSPSSPTSITVVVSSPSRPVLLSPLYHRQVQHSLYFDLLHAPGSLRCAIFVAWHAEETLSTTANRYVRSHLTVSLLAVFVAVAEAALTPLNYYPHVHATLLPARVHMHTNQRPFHSEDNN